MTVFEISREYALQLSLLPLSAEYIIFAGHGLRSARNETARKIVSDAAHRRTLHQLRVGLSVARVAPGIFRKTAGLETRGQ